MNIREMAERDLAITLEDGDYGYGQDVEITDPDGNTATLKCQTGDIGFQIDPDSGQAVSGRLAHVSIRLSSLAGAGLGVPAHEPAKTKKPWKFVFDDINGNQTTYTVRDSRPDRTLGIVTILLGFLKNG